MSSDAPVLLNRPIHHIGYAVQSIDDTVRRFKSALGVGPFYIVDNIEFDLAQHKGENCVVETRGAFAKWGSIFVEVMEVHCACPEPVASVLRYGQGTGVNHVAYLSETPEADSIHLASLGFEMILHLQLGRVIEWIHSSPFGHAIEVHTASSYLEDFFATVAEGADNWDGSEALRPAPEPR